MQPFIGKLREVFIIGHILTLCQTCRSQEDCYSAKSLFGFKWYLNLRIKFPAQIPKYFAGRTKSLAMSAHLKHALKLRNFVASPLHNCTEPPYTFKIDSKSYAEFACVFLSTEL